MLIPWSLGSTLVLALIVLPTTRTSPLPQHEIHRYPVLSHHERFHPNIESPDQLTREQIQRHRMQYLKQLENEVIGAVKSGSLQETVQLEQRLQDEILSAAVEALTNDRDQPLRQVEDLQKIDNLVKRDKRAVEVLTSLLGSSSGNKFGGGGGDGDGGESSGSASILNLVGPLLGSSSGGGGGGGGEGEASAGGGSDSGAILNLLGPLLGSSSGTSPEGESGGSNVLSLVSGLLGSSSGGGGNGDGSGSDAGGSGSGSILSLAGPLLGSSSSGGGGEASGSAAGGSDSGSILNLVGPLLGSSSGGGSSGGDGSDGGGGSGLLSVSNSSGGDKVGAINGAKAGIVQQKLQLFLRLKFALFTKMLNTLTSLIGSSSGGGNQSNTPLHELKYPGL